MKRKTPVPNMSMDERSKEESAVGINLENSMNDNDSDDSKGIQEILEQDETIFQEENRIDNSMNDDTIHKEENRIEESMKDDKINISKKSNKSIKTKKVIDPIATGFYGKKVEKEVVVKEEKDIEDVLDDVDSENNEEVDEKMGREIHTIDNLNAQGVINEKDIKDDMLQHSPNILILYDICGEIKYSIDSPLWYINFNDVLIRGPLSTQAICDLYKKKEINDKTLIRPNDLFTPKNKQYFSIEEIEASHTETFFTDNYEMNPIIDQVIKGYKEAEYNKKEKEVIKKYETEHNKNTVQIKQKKKYKNKKQKYESNPKIKVAFSYGQ